MKKRLLALSVLLMALVTITWAQTSMRSVPLTLEAVEDGTITFNNAAIQYVQYSINGGDVKYIAPRENGSSERKVVNIQVTAGDVVTFTASSQIYRHYDTYKDGNVIRGLYSTIECTGDCYIYGNIMSLLRPSNQFAGITSIKYSGQTTSQTFYYLFNKNTHIKNHPDKDLVLPATGLDMDCYRGMFNGCTGLTRAPQLPALALATGCYQNMFIGCTGLTEAPVLEATQLVQNCYNGMFKNCSNLSRVTCAATNITATDCLKGWLEGVATEGTFVKAPNITYAEGASGIPEGWTQELMPQPYAVYDKETTTLTFCNGDVSEMPAEDAWSVAGTSTTSNPNLWQQYRKEITRVVFDPSFKDARPQSCAYWFYEMEKLTDENLVGLENLNTSKCTSFKYMFSGCKGLKYLNLSNQSSSMVTDMSYMFSGSNIEVVDISKFSVSKVTEWTWMFSSNFLRAIIVNLSESISSWGVYSGVNTTQNIFNCSGVVGENGMPSNTNNKNAYAASYAYYFTKKTRTINTLGRDEYGYYWSSWYRGGANRQVDDNTIIYTGHREGDNIVLTELDTKIIPAGQAVILRSTESEITLTALAAPVPTEEFDNNELKGFDKEEYRNVDYQNDYTLELDSEDEFVFQKRSYSSNANRYIAYYTETSTSQEVYPEKLLLNIECKHKYNDEDDVNVGPSCTTPGYMAHVCYKCGYLDKYMEIPEVGHIPCDPVRQGDDMVVYCNSCGIELSRYSVPTGITSTENSHESHAPYFDLQGRRLNGLPAGKGVYIHNGHKVVVK